MVVKTVKLGGSASAISVAKTAHGLMMLTFKSPVVSDEEAFATIKAGIDQLPPGAKILLNSSEFYDRKFSPTNVELLSRFLEKYPELADKAFLSVKGGLKPLSLDPDGSPENIRRSVDTILKALRGKKKLDLFECARMDPDRPTEEVVKTLAGLVAEGKFDHIGLSEVGAATIRRANAVAPIAVVEIEISPFSYYQETKDVIATCAELAIPVLGYSPLGRGLLTGQIKKPDDLEEGDFRRGFTRFKQENIDHNSVIVNALHSIAAKKGITPAQLCIAWVGARGPHVIPLPGSSSVKRNLENLAGGDVELTAEELAEIDRVLASHTVKGHRYVDEAGDKVLHLWG